MGSELFISNTLMTALLSLLIITVVVLMWMNYKLVAESRQSVTAQGISTLSELKLAFDAQNKLFEERLSAIETSFAVSERGFGKLEHKISEIDTHLSKLDDLYEKILLLLEKEKASRDELYNELLGIKFQINYLKNIPNK